MRTFRKAAVLLFLSLLAAAPSRAAEKRLLTLDDLAAIRDVESPAISPDGEWVAYAVRTVDAAADRRTSDLAMTSWDGAKTVRLTHSKESESAPRFSPDGRRL